MTRTICIAFIAISFSVLCQVLPGAGQEGAKAQEIEGSPIEVRVLTKNELENILANHKKWIETNRKEGEAANLSKIDLSGKDLSKINLNEANLGGADLSGANLFGTYLKKANLSRANLSNANLIGADLSQAILIKADLKGADLTETNLSRVDLSGSDLSKFYLSGVQLSGADLFKVDLRGAHLNGTHLSGANLTGADLSKANLIDADLRGAFINGTRLSGANLNGANLNHALFQPQSLPAIREMAFAVNLSKMSYSDSRQALTELREGFKKGGLRKQEREITYAINHTHRKKLWDDKNSSILSKIESSFYLVFFELTCAYAMSPGRLILILIGFIFVFTIPYTAWLSIDSEDGIWVVWIEDRIRKDLGRKEPYRLTGSGWFTLKWGFYFSILSAFSIGWRDINVGNWIARMQRREYVLKPTGWVRTVSGFQSLLSVYLLALWVLSYFGRPFEAV